MYQRQNTIIVYGSYGYTGRLIVKECLTKNLNVILAGRNQSALEKQSIDTRYPFEVVDIQNAKALDELLSKGCVVIHCGGPFQYTATKMVDACIRSGTHYTDITGEYQVFEELQKYHDRAKQKHLMILPGVGFDVVPSDCLAVHLKQRLPDASNLQIAFLQTGGGLSRGTGKTMIEGLGYGSVIRVNGKLTTIPLGEKVMNVPFGDIPTDVLNIPWGDISTAWMSTGIPNIEVYMAAKPSLIRNAKLSEYFNWLLRIRWLKDYLQKKLDQKPDGPRDEQRLNGKTLLWGKVWNSKGTTATTQIEVPNGYTITATASVKIAQRILEGKFTPGYQTPAMAYGPDLILEMSSSGWIE
jgi:short subunit dehydrogenase-like uncharacterized protein